MKMVTRSGLPSRRTLPLSAGLFTSALLLLPAAASAQTASYLMVKLGDEAATPGQAVEFLESMSSWLKTEVPSLEGKGVEGHIANRRSDALELLHAHAPVLAFVAPGFYLGELEAAERPAHLVAQVPRFGAREVRYYLVAPAGAGASRDGLKGGTVRTTFDFDEAYLRRVVFPDDFQPGRDFRLEPADNLADELFHLLEGGPGAPDALLLDEELKGFFEEDDFVWSELEVVWSSEPLPPDLVVALGDWSAEALDALREALFSMGGSAEGEALLDLMDSEGFEPVDAGLLDAVRVRFESGR